MTARVLRASAPGLLAKLVETVRPEFRADPLIFDPEDPVFGTGRCRVAGCGRFSSGHGLCSGHWQRWVTAGRPDLEAFAASTDPRWRRQQPSAACRVEDCFYGSARSGLCQLHGQRWTRSGKPDLAAWLATAAPVRPPVTESCIIEHCRLWPQAAHPLCHTHYNTWKVNGRPDVAAFAASFARITPPANEHVTLAGLGRQLRLEVGYGLQQRADQRTTKTSPELIYQAVRILAVIGTGSLLELGEGGWREAAEPNHNAAALIVFMRRAVSDLAEADGWEAEYPRDRWQLRRLGFPGNLTARFDAITQPELREMVKRWMRMRLSGAVHVETARRGLRALTYFARFCDKTGISTLAQVDRVVLERYRAHLHTELGARHQAGVYIGQLGLFLDTVRQHRWDSHLPASAVIYSDDHPRRTERPPRALAEHVMAQVEDPANLERWGNDAYRLATVILIRCGLRITDALSLATDCVVRDREGAPYLRYFNHKMDREALVPIDEELEAMITEHRAASSGQLLFPRPTKNPDGAAPVSSSTYRLALYRWLERCEVRDELGHPVRFTPHQWRHTLGTRLINRDVPQEVVRRILDHDSPLMTAHYARLHDETVRRHWQAAKKVDVTGASVSINPDGPLAEAAWAKQRLGQATQALSNGYCALPVVKSCPHANACLTCPMFITTAEFLPQHRRQRHQLLQIASAARTEGRTRMAEMNQTAADNLTSIITALEEDHHAESRHDDAA